MNVTTMSRILLTVFILMLLIFVFGFSDNGYKWLAWASAIICALLLGMTWLPWQRWIGKDKAKSK